MSESGLAPGCLIDLPSIQSIVDLHVRNMIAVAKAQTDYFSYELGATKSSKRSIVYEFTLAVPASLFMGFGIVMLFSAIGIHV
ncbi:hypothetical protein HDU99_004533 [Rhizoclosmatium hyalinum]|nr:hypothetical protein HDU99_004533 [Rhizoclosmatium hyalinum]